MTTLDRLRDWNQTGTLTDVQHDPLSALVCKARFSVFLEPNAALDIGVLSPDSAARFRRIPPTWAMRSFSPPVRCCTVGLVGVLVGLPNSMVVGTWQS